MIRSIDMLNVMEKWRKHIRLDFYQSNRSASILVKETVCKAYAEGEELNYEGKQ